MLDLIRAVAIVVLLPSLAIAADFPVLVESVHDGDTFTATVAHGWRNTYTHHERIRIDGIDAWEINRTRDLPITDAEITKGKAAREALTKLLTEAKLVTVGDFKTEKYGRAFVRVFVDGRDVATLLIAGGHSRDVDERGRVRK